MFERLKHWWNFCGEMWYGFIQTFFQNIIIQLELSRKAIKGVREMCIICNVKRYTIIVYWVGYKPIIGGISVFKFINRTKSSITYIDQSGRNGNAY